VQYRSEAYSELTDEAIQLHGGYGYTEQFPVARAWRDQRLLRIGEGANEIVRVAIVNQLLRRDKAGRLPLLTADLPTVSGDDSLMTFANTAKSTALQLLRIANQKLGIAGLLEAQEVAAGIADTVCIAYAQESIALRVAKMRADENPNAAVAEQLARVAALGHMATLTRAMQNTLWCLEHVGSIDTVSVGDEQSPPNPMSWRRKLAAIVLERGGYPLV
jgi:hypothetical protein